MIDSLETSSGVLAEMVKKVVYHTLEAGTNGLVIEEMIISSSGARSMTR
ncbi:MAG: hypothetical protein ACLS36_08650 [Streptococcus sp.]